MTINTPRNMTTICQFAEIVPATAKVVPAELALSVDDQQTPATTTPTPLDSESREAGVISLSGPESDDDEDDALPTAAEIEARQDALEAEYLDILDKLLEDFAGAVIDDALGALSNSNVLIAAANPFAFTNVMKHWYDVVRTLAQDHSQLANLVPDLRNSLMPDDMFNEVADILVKAQDEGWTEYQTKRHLSKALIPKQQPGEPRGAYRARVSALARGAATRQASEETLEKAKKHRKVHNKKWVTQHDGRVRHMHADADGQVVNLNERFIVGGEYLDYPGDPNGSAGNVVNCRCFVIPVRDEEVTNPSQGTLFASADAPHDTINPEVSTMKKRQKWQGILAVENQLTGDGRYIVKGAIRLPEGPQPLRNAPTDFGAHDGAVVVGQIERVWRGEDNEDGSVFVHGEGFLDLESEQGQEAARHLGEKLTTGVSLDLDDVSYEVRIPTARAEAEDEMIEAVTNGEAPERETVGDQTIVYKSASGDEIMWITDCRMRAATIVAIPAFAQANLELVATTEDEQSELEALPAIGEDSEEDALVASGGPMEPPAAWFADPHLAGPTPLTVTDDGRVFGHVATWGTCHIGVVGKCQEPPHSITDYAYFKTGMLKLDNGDRIAVGHLTMGTGHAGPSANAAQTMAHYDNTGTVMADVNVGEDSYGIWVAGATRPGITEEEERAFNASPLSGDWRSIGGNLELVAALAVNVPGFPIPRAQGYVTAGETASLMAAGMLVGDNVPKRAETLSDDDVRILKSLAVTARRAEIAERENKLATIREVREELVKAQLAHAAQTALSVLQSEEK